MIKSG